MSKEMYKLLIENTSTISDLEELWHKIASDKYLDRNVKSYLMQLINNKIDKGV